MLTATHVVTAGDYLMPNCLLSHEMEVMETVNNALFFSAYQQLQ